MPPLGAAVNLEFHLDKVNDLMTVYICGNQVGPFTNAEQASSDFAIPIQNWLSGPDADWIIKMAFMEDSYFVPGPTRSRDYYLANGPTLEFVVWVDLEPVAAIDPSISPSNVRDERCSTPSAFPLHSAPSLTSAQHLLQTSPNVVLEHTYFAKPPPRTLPHHRLDQTLSTFWKRSDWGRLLQQEKRSFPML